MVGFLAAAIGGLVVCWKRWKQGELQYLWLYIMSISLTLSYIISRYFLVGENILARRMDAVLALFFLILFCLVFNKMVLNWGWHHLLLVIFVCSAAISASYSLGPNTNTVSADEYSAMSYIWSQEKDNTPYCVIAGTYPLLALEAISGKEIIGGGFPINEYFAQPELTNLFSTIKNEKAFSSAAFDVTNSSQCWLVGENKLVTEKQVMSFGSVNVWRFEK